YSNDIVPIAFRNGEINYGLRFEYSADWSEPIFNDSASHVRLKSPTAESPIGRVDDDNAITDFRIYENVRTDSYALMLFPEDDQTLWLTETDNPVPQPEFDSENLPSVFEGYDLLPAGLDLIDVLGEILFFGADERYAITLSPDFSSPTPDFVTPYAIGRIYTYEYDVELDAFVDSVRGEMLLAQETGLYGRFEDPTNQTYPVSYSYVPMPIYSDYIELSTPTNLDEIDLRTANELEATVLRLRLMRARHNEIDEETGVPVAMLNILSFEVDLDTDISSTSDPDPVYTFDYSYDGGTVGIPQVCRYVHRYYAPFEDDINYYLEYNICALNADSLDEYEDDLALVLDSMTIDLP
ncbi:MAG: hypothetical protein AAFQ07_19100, partial [Chloroflexota bacterium]